MGGGALTLSAVRSVVAAPSQVGAGRADDTIQKVAASSCRHAAAGDLPGSKARRNTRVVELHIPNPASLMAFAPYG